MASRDTKDLHQTLRDAYYKACEIYKSKFPNDPQPFITCTFRSNDEQLSLYKQPSDGKDNNGNGIIDDPSEKVTQALPGQSPHNFKPSYAFDVAFISVKQKLDWNIGLFQKFADIIKEVEPNVDWGGGWRFKDPPHYELKGWKSQLT